MPFIALEELEVREPVEGYRAKFVHSDGMTLAHWVVEAGAELPEHSHPHEQVVNVVDGEFELTIDGVTQAMHPGWVAVIPPNAIHSGKAITECRLIDAFHPTRDDYR